jgi:galactokinase
MMKKEITAVFRERFGAEPYLFSAPGRVNLIGEHTDYNEGFVLPASVDKAIHFAIKPNSTGLFRFYAIDLDESFETSIEKIEPSKSHWANYLMGVIAQFVKNGKNIPGFDCAFGGDVPLGAGMSSSAAIEVGMAYALNHIFSFSFSKFELVKFAQMAEHEYAGVKCGIMDQFASMYGKANHVIKLDCRSLEYQYFPLDTTNHLLVLVNTGVKHSLATSEYNKRRQECEHGVALLKKYVPTIHSLRDVSLDLIESHKSEFNPITYNRCSYVIEENIRLEKACKALENADFVEFGNLMYGSHYGLKNKYEVSCTELDQLVELTKSIDGVLGARMMGGGFGGCTINLVKKDSVASFEKTITENYKTPEGKQPQIIKVVIEDGAKGGN